MRKMKDSGIEWIGEIPEDWEVTKYKYYAQSGMGSTILQKDLNDNGIPVYSATQSNKIFGYVNECNIVLNKGDLVIPARGNSIGNTTIINDNCATCTQTTIYSKLHGINNLYLYYCTYGLKDYWFEYDNTAIPQITVEQVQNNIVPVPMLEEQELIADYLDEKVQQIDNIISKTQKTIEEYKKYKQSVITEAVTKGLNPNVEMKDSGIEWIGEIPKDWDIKKIKFISNIVMGQSPDSETITDNGEILFMQGNVDFNDIYPTPKTYCDNPKKKSRINDILMSVRAPVGALNISDKEYGIGRGLCSIMPLDITQKYLWYFLKKSVNDFKYYSNGSTFDAITVNILNNFFVTLPNRNEQQTISNFLDKKCNEIDKLITKKQELINQLETYKKSLIYECVTGKKEVLPAYAY